MIKIIRNFFGLTQSELARHLLIPRSNLSMSESAERNSISGEKFRKLVRISLVVPEVVYNLKLNDPLKDADLKNKLKDQAAKLKKDADKRFKECHYKFLKTQLNLAEIKDKQERALMVIGQLSLLKEKTLPEDESLVSFIERRARERQKQTAIDVQFKLEAQLAGLQTEMDFIKKYLED